MRYINATVVCDRCGARGEARLPIHWEPRLHRITNAVEWAQVPQEPQMPLGWRTVKVPGNEHADLCESCGRKS